LNSVIAERLLDTWCIKKYSSGCSYKHSSTYAILLWRVEDRTLLLLTFDVSF